MDWAQVLVIILAVVLAIFLLLGIVLAVLLIRVTRQIKSVTSSAQRTVDQIEHAAAGISRLTSPLLVLRTLKGFLKRKGKKHE